MKKFLPIILILTSFATKAQNFVPGYIITNADDTLYGQIDLRTSIINQEKCVFRQNNEITVYNPFEIQGYFFTDEGKYYVSKTIEINNQTINAFVEFLLKGMMNLHYFEIKEPENISIEYYGNNPISKYFLFEKGDGTTLVLDKRPDRFHDQSHIVSDTRYKGKIRFAFDSIKPIADNYEKVEFTQKSMINTARLYHDAVCTTGEPCVIFSTKRPDYFGNRLSISVYSGMQYAVYSARAQITPHFIYSRAFPLKFSEDNKTISVLFHSFSPVIGSEINLKNPRISNSLSLSFAVELSMLYGTNDKYYKYPQNDEFGFKVQSEFNALFPRALLGLNYTYPKGKNRPSAGVGASYGRLIANDEQIRPNAIGGYAFAGFQHTLPNSNALNFKIDVSGFACFLGVDSYMGLYINDALYTVQLKMGYVFNMKRK